MCVICVQLTSCFSLVTSQKCAVVCLQKLPVLLTGLIQHVTSQEMSICAIKNQNPYEWACNLFFSYLLPQYFIFLLNSQCPRNLRAAFLLLCSWADISELPAQLYFSLKGFVLVLSKSCMNRSPFGGKHLVILSKCRVLKIHRVNLWVVTEDLTRKLYIYNFWLTLAEINGIQTKSS